ncbi:MAG: ABC transporter permease [Nitrososphaerota archaeon]|nr:ABC transporter permease [Nitrososphaerota archaeon]MDG6921869.1 ABC transporter permease [Nitrososphaerota archaeon]
MSITTDNASLEGNKLPSSLQQVGIITKNEMLNYFRSRRFLILLVIDLIISSLLTFAIWHDGISNVATDALGFYSTWWGIAANLMIVFCAVFFGGDAISGEFQNKTGYFLVGNPVRRSSIYIGKWIAAFVASLIIMGIFTAIAIANGSGYFGAVLPNRFVEALGFTILYLISALGFTFFFSSVFKTSAMSIMVTVILLLFGFLLIDELLTNLVHIEPWFSLSYGSGIISDVMTVPYPQHISSGHVSPSGNGPIISTYHATILEGIAIMVIYFVVTAIVGLYLFERKEFN